MFHTAMCHQMRSFRKPRIDTGEAARAGGAAGTGAAARALEAGGSRSSSHPASPPSTRLISAITKNASRQLWRVITKLTTCGWTTEPTAPTAKRMPSARPRALSNQACSSFDRVSTDAPEAVKIITRLSA